MSEAGLDVPKEWLLSAESNVTEPAKVTAMRALRQLNITAMVCSSDIVAFGTIQAAAELGIRIPDDLSVTGFDGIGLDKMIDPKLTTAEQPVFKIGRRLAEILLQRQKCPNDKSPPIHELFETTLVPRDSTARIKVT
jgi:LacI family transcriptional regulator